MSEAGIGPVVTAIISFGSAVLGSAVGGVLAYLASMRAARYTMQQTADLDRKRREEERAEMRCVLGGRLLAEMRENIAVLANPMPEWGFVVALHDTWDLMKGQVSIQTDVDAFVAKAYTEVAWYNTVISGAAVDHDAQRYLRNYPNLVQERAKKARDALQEAATSLEKYLSETGAVKDQGRGPGLQERAKAS